MAPNEMNHILLRRRIVQKKAFVWLEFLNLPNDWVLPPFPPQK